MGRFLPWLFISNLRLRASYGIQGNIDRNTYPFIIGTYNNVSLLPDITEEGIEVSMPANDKLRWEKTQSWNAGLDFAVFNNRLQFTVDYYNRNSTDLIGTSALPLENGFTNVQRNWAAVKNDGIELMISSRNIVKDNFTWSTDFNIAHNRNKLTRVMSNPTAYSVDVREGYPVNSLFVLETAGLDQDGVIQFKGEDGNPVAYEDFYGLYDPWADFFPGYLLATSLSPEEYQSKFKYKGSLDPKFTGGMTNRFRYKAFDFAVSMVFNIDKWTSRSPFYNPARVDRGVNYNREIMDAVTAGGSLPHLGSTDVWENARWMPYSWMMDNDPISSFKNLDIWSKKMSYLRVNSLRLGYTLPKAVANKIQASNIRFHVEGRNLFVFGTNYDGYFDPETYGNNYAQPIAKSIAFGLSASF